MDLPVRRRLAKLRGTRRYRRAEPRRSPLRWAVVAVGLAVLATGVGLALGPYRQTRMFRAVVDCDRGPGQCFATEHATVHDRRTYTTTTTRTDANGNTETYTTTHYEVAVERADGSLTSMDVPSGFYDHARKGEPIDLRMWRGDVVGVEVMGATAWFLPASGERLGIWFAVAWAGLGILLWGLFGWWDGVFMLVWRAGTWMMACIFPVILTTDALAYGWHGGAAVVAQFVFGALFTGVSVAMLAGSLRERW